eukprot:TRINITY_DN8896_c0_g1_i1.p1 TRINITY_DN8896_c0_g1~~TRINITY_DN8896_c0_g1_i1.p1  ORF type:complete len:401 (+),score=65.34 TRINITY_DN8896_c0_g1_i1:108-1310(+)
MHNKWKQKSTKERFMKGASFDYDCMNYGRMTSLQWGMYEDAETDSDPKEESRSEPEVKSSPSLLLRSTSVLSTGNSSTHSEVVFPRTTSSASTTSSGRNLYELLRKRKPQEVGTQKDHYSIGEWVSMVQDLAQVEAAYDTCETLTWIKAASTYLGKRGEVEEVDESTSTIKIRFGNGRSLWAPTSSVLTATKKRGGEEMTDDGEEVFFHLVRHGETTWNSIHRLQGQRDTALSEKGKLQAKNLRKVLKPSTYDAVISSPLRRATDTAAIALGPATKVTDVQLEDERLMETDLGTYSGKYSSDPQVAYFRRTMDEHTPWPGGESFSDVTSRALSALSDATILGNNIAIFTHGGVISSLITSVLGHSTAIPNCSVTVLATNPALNTWRVVSIAAAEGPHVAL